METAREAATATSTLRRVGERLESTGMVAGRLTISRRSGISPGESAVTAAEPAPAKLTSALEQAGTELALEVVRAGLLDGAVPAFGRLERVERVSGLPELIAALAREVADPDPRPARRGTRVADVGRDHARRRESLGFTARDVMTELALVRRIVQLFVARQARELEIADTGDLEARLNDALDRLTTECVVAYVDRSTLELAERARRDALTGLLNHQAFNDVVEAELERAERYDYGLSLVFVDLDRLQDRQRHLRPPGGRSGPARVRAEPRVGPARIRRGRAHGRRRVRGRAAPGRPRRGHTLLRATDRAADRARRRRAAPPRTRLQRRERALPLGGARRGRAVPARGRAPVPGEAREARPEGQPSASR